MYVIITCKYKKDPIKNSWENVMTPFSPIITLWELSVAMETRGMIWSASKPNAAFPPPQWCFIQNLVVIGLLVSEIFMFESVDARTDAGSSPIL